MLMCSEISYYNYPHVKYLFLRIASEFMIGFILSVKIQSTVAFFFIAQKMIQVIL